VDKRGCGPVLGQGTLCDEFLDSPYAIITFNYFRVQRECVCDGNGDDGKSTISIPTRTTDLLVINIIRRRGTFAAGTAAAASAAVASRRRRATAAGYCNSRAHARAAAPCWPSCNRRRHSSATTILLFYNVLLLFIKWW